MWCVWLFQIRSLESEIAGLNQLLDSKTEADNKTDVSKYLQQEEDLNNIQQQLKETNMDLFTKLQELEQKKEELESTNEQVVQRQCDFEITKSDAEKLTNEMEEAMAKLDRVKLELVHLQVISFDAYFPTHLTEVSVDF